MRVPERERDVSTKEREGVGRENEGEREGEVCSK